MQNSLNYEKASENEKEDDIELSDVIVSDLDKSYQKMDMRSFFRQRLIPPRISAQKVERENKEKKEAEKAEIIDEYQSTESAENIDRSKIPTQVFIIGTAHISKKSVEEVKNAIKAEKPDIVAIELCPSRYKGMTAPQDPDKELSVKEILAGGNVTYNLLYMLLANLQKKMGDEMGVPPGSEMIAAIEEAEEIGASIALIDRDVKTTFQRFIAKMGIREKIKLFYMLIGSSLGFGPETDQKIDLENITSDDIISELIEEFRDYAPTVAKVLIDERDAYLAGSIYETVRYIGPGKKVVVVIGAGHREGVLKYLADPEKIPQLPELEVIPKKRFSFGKIFAVLIVLVIFLLFGYILYSALTQPDISMGIFFEAFAYWFLINGVLSSLGAIVAGGHYTSVATAFAVSWMTSLNPFLAAGWLSGLVEARVRKPTVKDMKNVVNAETFKEMKENNFFKVLLVAALTNIGSIIGTFVAGYIVLKISGIDIVGLIGEAFSSITGLLF